MKVIKPITTVCPSEDEMELEIELAYLNKTNEYYQKHTSNKRITGVWENIKLWWVIWNLILRMRRDLIRM